MFFRKNDIEFEKLYAFYLDNIEIINMFLKEDMNQKDKKNFIKFIYDNNSQKQISRHYDRNFKVYRGISALNESLLQEYITDFINGKMHFGSRASIYGTGVYMCCKNNASLAKKYATDGESHMCGAVIECLLSTDTTIISYEQIVEKQENLLISLGTKSCNKNYQMYIQMLNDVGLFANILGYDAIYVREKGYVIILNSKVLHAINIEYCDNEKNKARR